MQHALKTDLVDENNFRGLAGDGNLIARPATPGLAEIVDRDYHRDR